MLYPVAMNWNGRNVSFYTVEVRKKKKDMHLHRKPGQRNRHTRAEHGSGTGQRTDIQCTPLPRHTWRPGRPRGFLVVTPSPGKGEERESAWALGAGRLVLLGPCVTILSGSSHKSA